MQPATTAVTQLQDWQPKIGFASGFDTAVDQEAQNVICTHPGNNATCTQEGAASTSPTSASNPPTPRPTCAECFTDQGLFTQDQIVTILKVLNKTSVADLCAALENGTLSVTNLIDVIDKVAGHTVTTALLACIGIT